MPLTEMVIKNTRSAPISDVTLLAALRPLGYDKESLLVYGFRSMASTLLQPAKVQSGLDRTSARPR